MRRETIEEFDGAGNLVKRTVTEWNDVPMSGDIRYVRGVPQQTRIWEPLKVTSYHTNSAAYM